MLSRKCLACSAPSLRLSRYLLFRTTIYNARRRLNSDLAHPQRLRSPRNITILLLLGLVPAGYYISKGLIPHDEPILSPREFSPFKLQSRIPVSATSSIYTLQPASTSISTKQIPWPEDPSIWSIQIKQPELNIARSYTPLPPVESGPREDEAGADTLRLLVRSFPGGELSTYLSRLPEGAILSLRGPYQEFTLPNPEEVGEVVFLAGGTGIAPALQLAHAILPRKRSENDVVVHETREPGAKDIESTHQPSVRICWAVRSSEECLGGITTPQSQPSPPANFLTTVNQWLTSDPPPSTFKPPLDPSSSPNPIVQSLNALQTVHPTSCNVQYYPDDAAHFITSSVLSQALYTKTSPLPTSQDEGSPRKRNILLVSGPDGFVDSLAGPRIGRDLAAPAQARQLNVRGKLGEVLPALESERGIRWEVYRL
ncbi:MAG: mitochondrial peripheral inner membrane protein [Chaenotheca gracillima]|nr:MAG: mitochondrial peripheral inner membrane protein [Chaenotheca gracillima]